MYSSVQAACKHERSAKFPNLSCRDENSASIRPHRPCRTMHCSRRFGASGAEKLVQRRVGSPMLELLTRSRLPQSAYCFDHPKRGSSCLPGGGDEGAAITSFKPGERRRGSARDRGRHGNASWRLGTCN